MKIIFRARLVPNGARGTHPLLTRPTKWSLLKLLDKRGSVPNRKAIILLLSLQEFRSRHSPNKVVCCW